LTILYAKRLSNDYFKDLLNNIEIEVNHFFSSEELEHLAKETLFVQRDGKINGRNFFDLVVFNNDNLKDYSLNDLSIDLSEKYHIDITKQSLQDRFNDNALSFLKTAFERLLNQQIDTKSLLPLAKGFKRILIKDSACFQIDESLADHYPGSGGAGSKAAIRIQFEYDLLNGRINDLSVNAFNEQDATNSLETIELTRQGDLIIRDLAYMNLSFLEMLRGYFLARLQHNVKVLEKIDDGFQELDFVKTRNYMMKYKLSVIEKKVYIGSQKRIPVRLIIHLLPDNVVAERLRKGQQSNKKKGRKQLSQEYKARAALNLFITNASEKQIPTMNVYQLYRLRWQIELTFKIWKSLCNIDKVKKVKRERLECYIYGKLIFIVFAWRILWVISKFMFSQEKKMLSYYKAFKTLLRKKLDELRDIVFQRTDHWITFTIDFYNLSKHKHVLEKRMKEQTSIEILITCLNP
jgi:hypothetical protein